jgi:hypothetical protein
MGCICCGEQIHSLEYDYVHRTWEGRMDGYCENCANMRCDAYPGQHSK